MTQNTEKYYWQLKWTSGEGQWVSQRRERLCNDTIQEIMGIKHTIMDNIKTKQLLWYGQERLYQSKS